MHAPDTWVIVAQMTTATDGKPRCFGNGPGQQRYAEYHDTEWGVPERDPRWNVPAARTFIVLSVMSAVASEAT